MSAAVHVRSGDLEQDLDSLADLYAAAVRVTAGSLYTPAQIEAWATWPDDRIALRAFLQPGVLLVAEVEDQLAGLGYLHPADHLSLLYTAPAFGRRGIATLLCQALEAASRQAGCTGIYTEASKLSRPLFERQGYTVQHIEEVSHYGVDFRRYRMSKTLG